MAGTGATTAATLLREVRTFLADSTAADVVALRLGENPTQPARLVARMTIGSTVTIYGSQVRRLTDGLWEFQRPNVDGCVMVGRDAGGKGWKTVRFSDDPPMVVGETRTADAGLSAAFDDMAALAAEHGVEIDD